MRSLLVVLVPGVLVLTGCSVPSGDQTTADGVAVASSSTSTTPSPQPSSVVPTSSSSSSSSTTSSSSSFDPGPHPMPDPAPGAPEEVRTGTLEVVLGPGRGVRQQACLVLHTRDGRFDLLSAEGLWIPSAGVEDGRPDPDTSGIGPGDGLESTGPLEFHLGDTVRIRGQALVPPPQGFPSQCDDVPDLFSIIDVDPA